MSEQVESDEYRVQRTGVRMAPEQYDFPDPDVRVEVRVELRGVVREASLEVPHDTVADGDLMTVAEDTLERVADAARSMFQAGGGSKAAAANRRKRS